MLIRFTVSNFLSFREEAEFSMIPGKSRQHSHHIIKSEKYNGVNVLKAGVIYGANASGKSNLIKAMEFARDLIVEGTKPNKPISVTHFKLDESYDSTHSKFEFEFQHNTKAYAYGFELDYQQIYKEWLYEINKTNQKKIFERSLGENGKARIKLGNFDFKDGNERKLVELMKIRKNQLFLTQSFEAGVEQFTEVYSWFDKILKFIFPHSRPLGLEIRVSQDNKFKDSLQGLLRSFNTGVSGVCHQKMSLNDVLDIPDEIKSSVIEDLEVGQGALVALPERQYTIVRDGKNEFQIYKVMTEHTKKGNPQSVLFEINEESDGTQRLMELGPALLELLSEERVFVIDELDRSLHPRLSREIIDLFLNNQPEHRSQLIVSTHESSLLDLKLLRRDEIWFVEKDQEGASTVYSLEEFVPRYDKDIRRGYLSGRFGAIPIVHTVSDLGW